MSIISSKNLAEQEVKRKAAIDLQLFVSIVLAWQEGLPVLHEADKNLKLLVVLLWGEITEVLEQQEKEGLPDYQFKSHVGELMDVLFFTASISGVLQDQLHEKPDYNKVIFSANGQASGSNALYLLSEVGGNISEKSLKSDLEYFLTIVVSYMVHMSELVNPTKVLREYTIPKNSGNYIKKFLGRNPVYEKAHGKPMDRDARLEYFAHYRKATRIIRDFILKYVDPSIEHTGMRPEHYEPYEAYIFGFEVSGVLKLLEAQLYVDYGVAPSASKVLQLHEKKQKRAGCF